MRRLLIALLGSLAVAGCDVINPEEPEAAFLKLERPLLVDKGDTLAGLVPDVWLFHVPELHGAFVPPATIPLLETDTRQEVVARAGVWAGYDAEAHEVYPFLKFDTLRASLQVGQTTVFQPVFSYYPDTLLATPFEENFEGMEVKFRRYGAAADTAMLVRLQDAALALQGQSCGRVLFTENNTSFDVETIATFSMPNNGTEVWAEVKFRGNIKFALGLISLYPGRADQAFTPQIITHGYDDDGQWRAAYFRLTVAAVMAQAGTQWRLRLLSRSDGSNRELYLDNVRIIHFK